MVHAVQKLGSAHAWQILILLLVLRTDQPFGSRCTDLFSIDLNTNAHTCNVKNTSISYLKKTYLSGGGGKSRGRSGEKSTEKSRELHGEGCESKNRWILQHGNNNKNIIITVGCGVVEGECTITSRHHHHTIHRLLEGFGAEPKEPYTTTTATLASSRLASQYYCS